MEINYVLIVGAAVLSMVIGGIWYGPLFGKKWLEIIGATDADLERRKQMQKAAMPLYIVQFLLTMLQLYILTVQIQYSGIQSAQSGMWYGFFIWLGFVMPTVAGSAMWNNNASKVKWAMFLIQAGYQLVMFLIFGWILGNWA